MSSLSQLFDLALQHHQAGRLQQAELAYRQVLQADPRHAGALGLFGLLLYQAGRSDLAVDYIQAALRVRPDMHSTHNNLGIVQQDLGKLDEAVRSYREALRLMPDYAEAHCNLAEALREQGKLDEAIGHCRQAVRLKPGFAEAYSNLAIALRQLGKLDEAIAAGRQALQLKPGLVAAYRNLGVALQERGNLDEAISTFQQTLRLKPDYAEVYSDLGNALREQGKVDQALAAIQHALRLKPDLAEAHCNLGHCLQEQGRLEEAITSYHQALRTKPGLAEAHHGLGTVRRDQGRFEEAIQSYREALRLKPADFGPAVNLGIALQAVGRIDEAITCYEQVLRSQPANAEAHYNLGTALLLEGAFSEGWPHYERRWQTRVMQPSRRHFQQPLWQGNALPQATILLHAEQGLGDTIHFVRYAALVKQRVGTVLCACPTSLTRLLKTCAGIDRIIPHGEALPAFDVHAPLLSLPGILQTTLETLPAPGSYLDSEPALVEQWKKRLLTAEKAAPALRIGIVWQGNPLHRRDRQRSVPLELFAPLTEQAGVRLVSLQKEPGSEQLRKRAGLALDIGSELSDFADTAAVIRCLDLVIAVDTAVVHLAGALGAPVWVALPKIPDWRWLLERADSPWYPSMRLFRQTVNGQWDDVFSRVKQALATYSPRLSAVRSGGE